MSTEMLESQKCWKDLICIPIRSKIYEILVTIKTSIVMRKRILLRMCGQQKFVSAYAPTQTDQNRRVYAPYVLCIYFDDSYSFCVTHDSQMK